jgi:sugar phosphate isomerase/epimerase
MEDFLDKVKKSGFDGIDTWVPPDRKGRVRLRRLLEEYDLTMVSQQYQAEGKNIKEFCKSFDYYLQLSAETNPLLINSHSGRDSFSLQDQLKVLDTAFMFEHKSNIAVAHETHRGRLAFSPGNAQQLFNKRKQMRITADLSHWVCVTESYLPYFESTLKQAIERTIHVHARVGHPQGPQVPDPRLPAWSESLNQFSTWWSRIIESHRNKGTSRLTFTTEFGPPPYMWTHKRNNAPVASQWELNLYIKSLLKEIAASSSI